MWHIKNKAQKSIHFSIKKRSTLYIHQSNFILTTYVMHIFQHPFVETIIKALPSIALERGVYTEEQLRKRFVKVAKVSRRLGLMSVSNTSLYKYLISMLQSFVVFDTVSAVSVTDQVDLNELDNYGLVAHAEHFMQQGDLETALKFMVQLSGESAVAASDWIKEARLLLETRQAATSLTAYASATGLANTF